MADLTKIPISDKFYPLFNNTDRYMIMYGGAGSAKSYTAAQKILIRLMNEQSHRFLICRKTAKSISDSCYRLFVDLIHDYDLEKLITINKSDYSFRCNFNGNEIRTTGLDDPEKKKSIQRITGMWIEEATELDEQDFRQLDLRLRGNLDNYKQIIITFNPVDERHWLKKIFFDNKPNNCTIHHSTFKDNKFIDAEYAKMLHEQITGDDNLKRIYIDGVWGKIITGQEFYHKFSYSRHVDKLDFIPNAAIHLSFDFNVVPYCTLECFQLVQHGDRWEIRNFDEFCLANPNNDPQMLCKRFIDTYSDRLINCPIYIYGDATGRATSTTGQKNGFIRKNNFDMIKDEMRKYLSNSSMRVPTFNPTLKARRQKMNRVLSGEWIFDLKINEKNKNMIADLESVQCDINGGKLKKKVMDKQIGQAYELYGHCSDALDYFVLEAFKNYMK